MFLESLEIKNFRTFYHDPKIGSKHKINFANSANFRCDDGKPNVAEKTTLIVGQNNSGKTTIVKALELLLKESPSFSKYDFNTQMLDEIFDTYTLQKLSSNEKDSLRMPEMEFAIEIGLDDPNDLITNVAQFLRLSDVSNKKIKIIAKWEIRERQEFFKKIEEVLYNAEKIKTPSDEELYNEKKYNDLLKLLHPNNFQLNFYNEENEKVENFKIYNLIEIVSIKANKVDSDKCLSAALKKIVEFRHKNRTDTERVSDLETNLFKAGCTVTNDIKNLHVSDISRSLGCITEKRVGVSVRADLTLTNLMNTLIKCEYLEGNKHIPENQYGLGYTNLIMIISEIISYVDRYHLDNRNSKVHIISIEEPETYMHPQMQELFIKNINDTLKELLAATDKHINSQLIITTHSSHILNSKIHVGGSFDNICYIKLFGGKHEIINISDTNIVGSNTEELNFIKKHIKYKVSELFFADAAIFVEGISEYTLLQYYIDSDEFLKLKYVSLIMIDGAHGCVYTKLIKMLGIPVAIITDIDIERSSAEKGKGNEKKYLQITDDNIKGRTTKNSSLIKFYDEEKEIVSIVKQGYKIEENLIVCSQITKCHGYYATSFEEAFILKNYDNKILVDTIKDTKPNIYRKCKNALDDSVDVSKSFELQCKLSDSKSDFANMLFYLILTKSTSEVPALPDYIQYAFNFINEQLRV